VAKQTGSKSTEASIPDLRKLIEAPELVDLQARSAGFIKQIPDNLVIDSDEELEFYSEQARIGAATIRGYEEFWKQPKKAAWDGYKAITAAIERLISPVKNRTLILDSAILRYQREKKQKAIQQQQADQKAAREEHESMFVEAAADLEREGRTGEAEALLESAIANAPSVAPVQTQAPMAKGVYITEKWSFEIFDESQIPREYLKVDETKIGKVVRAMQKDTNIPGVRAFPVDSLGKRLK